MGTDKNHDDRGKRVNSFAFYSNFMDGGRLLSDKERLKFYDSIIEYAFEGVEPELHGNVKLLFVGVKPAIDSSIRKSKNIQNRWNSTQDGNTCKNTEGNTSKNTEGNTVVSPLKKEKEKENKEGEGDTRASANPSVPSGSQNYNDDEYVGSDLPPPISIAEAILEAERVCMNATHAKECWDYWAGRDWFPPKSEHRMSKKAALAQVRHWNVNRRIFAERDAKDGGYKIRKDPSVVPVDQRDDIAVCPTALGAVPSSRDLYK